MEEIWKNVSIENIPGEEWLDIKEYEGLYMVSNFGRVKSLGNDKSRMEKIRKQGPAGKGYLQVILFKKGKGESSYVHRLVAEAFIPNPEGKPEVDHINGIKTDCRAVNLRWVSSIENKNNGISKKVMCVETGNVYESASEAGRQTGVHHQQIYACCKGKCKTVKGYHWQYAD